ncbi:helix-turn-helix domain-containing protein [Lachnospiraceae bacterium C1.1]|nr:helix-turn-helix transcriptional regulator [Lachnospiraceae bacterium C1.1]
MGYIENANDFIKDKIKETNITQKEIAEKILGTNQPNFSSALNQKKGRRFTIEQYIALADYFGVSLDELFGRKTASSQISARSIGSWIIELFKSKRAIFKTIELNETDTDKRYDSYPTSTEYQALLFPNFDNNSARYQSFYFDKMVNGDSAYYDNSDHDNIAINAFIKKYLDIENFNSEKGMPEEAYNIVISTYLNELNSAPYCAPQKFREKFVPADEDLF